MRADPLAGATRPVTLERYERIDPIDYRSKAAAHVQAVTKSLDLEAAAKKLAAPQGA